MSVLTKVREFFLSARAEVTRVSWPSRKEVVTFTVFVILLTVALGVYLGVVDLMLRFLLRILVTK